MSKKDVGECLIQIGTMLLVAPLFLSLIVSFLYLISEISFSTTSWIVFGCIAYVGTSIGLISYGKRLAKN
jgi:hypothetical protein